MKCQLRDYHILTLAVNSESPPRPELGPTLGVTLFVVRRRSRVRVRTSLSPPFSRVKGIKIIESSLEWLQDIELSGGWVGVWHI